MNKQKLIRIIFKLGIIVLIFQVLLLAYAKLNNNPIASGEWVRLSGLIGPLIVMHFYMKKQEEQNASN